MSPRFKKTTHNNQNFDFSSGLDDEISTNFNAQAECQSLLKEMASPPRVEPPTNVSNYDPLVSFKSNYYSAYSLRKEQSLKK